MKNIIFDVGKVLVAWEPEEAMRKLNFTPETLEKVANATVRTEDWNESDRGALSDEEMLQLFFAKAPECEKEIRMFWENISMAITQFPYTRAWIKSLKRQGYQVYILSNYASWTYKMTKDNQLDFLEDVDGAVFSYEVKQIKPEDAIYQTLLKKYNLDANECVFLDDRAENTAAAGRNGIHAITFTDIDTAKKELKKYGIDCE